MLIRHNPDSFLTGDDPFLPTRPIEQSAERMVEELTFEPRHEGFIGIPHGGLAMGLCLDAWRRMGQPQYPVSAKFRFGGSGIGIMDSAVFTVERDGDGSEPVVVARITKKGEKNPYLRAEIRSSSRIDNSGLVGKPPGPDFRKLPYYRNCFVCGHHRNEPGLQRRFRLHEGPGENLVTATWGHDPDDGDRTRLFLLNRDELHPAILASIFDENTAWAGFWLTRSAGLSVRTNLTLLRPVYKNEPLLFVGRPVGIKGNPRAPRFFSADGTVFSMLDAKSPEPVAYGDGDWIIMQQYSKQIRQNLLPENDWQWIFGEE
jgi:hypothetical protein